MKLKLIGDLHIRASNPLYRIDNYFEAIWTKLTYIIDYEKNVPILQPGDFFDSPLQPNSVLSWCIDNLKGVKIFSVYGQHDLKFRNKGNTALDVLISSGTVIVDDSYVKLDNKTFLYFCSFGEDIPEITTDGFNILLIHKMVVEDKLWEGQTDYVWANSLLRQHKFDLIVSGDNHKSFFVEHGNRCLINCGSLMRSTRDQINHKPCFVLFDTETRSFEINKIPIEPAEKVFDMLRIKEEMERNDRLSAFIEGINNEDNNIGLDFKNNLIRVAKENKVSDEIMKIIMEVMQGG
jgi:DNA repair exonuclease SbcCD nuclease subunit